eukprot:Awhi_evm2s2199
MNSENSKTERFVRFWLSSTCKNKWSNYYICDFTMLSADNINVLIKVRDKKYKYELRNLKFDNRKIRVTLVSSIGKYYTRDFTMLSADNISVLIIERMMLKVERKGFSSHKLKTDIRKAVVAGVIVTLTIGVFSYFLSTQYSAILQRNTNNMITDSNNKDNSYNNYTNIDKVNKNNDNE